MASIILYRSDAGEKLLRVEEKLLRTANAFGTTQSSTSSTDGAVDATSTLTSTSTSTSTPTSGAMDALFRYSIPGSRSRHDGAHDETRESQDGTNLITEDFDADAELDGQLAKISISHDGVYATAVCLAAEEPSLGDVGGEAAARGL